MIKTILGWIILFHELIPQNFLKHLEYLCMYFCLSVSLSLSLSLSLSIYIYIYIYISILACIHKSKIKLLKAKLMVIEIISGEEEVEILNKIYKIIFMLIRMKYKSDLLGYTFKIFLFLLSLINNYIFLP